METTSRNSSANSTKSFLPKWWKVRFPLKNLDQALLLSLVFFYGLGLVQVYSASYIFAIENYQDGLFFFRKQMLFTVFSIFCLLILAKLPWLWLKRLTPWMWVVAIALLVLSFVPSIGVKVNGARRWIDLQYLRIQPAEFLRILLPLFFAYWVSLELKLKRIWFWLLSFILIALPILALLKQPDFGNFVLCYLVLMSMLFVVGLKWKYLFANLAIGLTAFLALIWFVPYRKARLLSFLDPWSDPMGKGFQSIQSMLSFYSGGTTGVGLGQGQGKLFFLPEAHTDFTLAVLGEETGFIGIAFVLLLYAYLCFRAFQIALVSENKMAQIAALGLAINFALQVFVNIGVVMGMLPTKGITLPFLSYGGSSLLATSILFGVLLNIDRHQEYFQRRHV